jgi:fused signal recognition particle receptor
MQCLLDAKQRQGDGAIDIVLCDTAGRLHTAYALMEELQARKSILFFLLPSHSLLLPALIQACKAAIGKAVPGQPDETLLVLDGTTGLNMLNQVRRGRRARATMDYMVGHLWVDLTVLTV